MLAALIVAVSCVSVPRQDVIEHDIMFSEWIEITYTDSHVDTLCIREGSMENVRRWGNNDGYFTCREWDLLGEKGKHWIKADEVTSVRRIYLPKPKITDHISYRLYEARKKD